MKHGKNLREILRAEDEGRLLHLLKTAEPDLQARVCLELGRRKAKTAAELLRRRLGADDPALREAAAEALGKIGDYEAAERLLSLFIDQKQPVQVRDTCAYALARLSYRPALPKLLSSLADPNPSVRLCVVAALAAIGDPNVRESVLLALQTESDAAVREAMKRLLASIPDSKVRLETNFVTRLGPKRMG